MKRNFTSRHYFKEIFRAFLLMSIVPFLIFTSIIIYVNHSQNVSSMNYSVEESNRRSNMLLEDIIKKYSTMISELSKEDFIIDFLTGSINDKELKVKINPYIVSEESHIAVHIISSDYQITSSTAKIPSEYIRPEYTEYIYQNDIHNSQLPNIRSHWITSQNGIVPISIIMKIQDSEQVFGYIIIDVLRDKFTSSISDFDEDVNTIVSDKNGVVVFDSFEQLNEGKKIAPINNSVFEKSRTFSNVSTLENFQYEITSLLSIDNFSVVTQNLIKIFLIIIIIASIISAFLAHLQSKRIYRPINTILNTIKEVEEDPNIRMDENNGHSEMQYIALEFNSMLDKIESLNKELIENSERNSLSELKALQAQISPHFLYNMLNEIKSLAKLNRNTDVTIFIEHLGVMLRRSIDNANRFITLDEDLEFIISYLELQKIRYENSFDYSINIESEASDFKIPNLIIQPIIENSIVHGFSTMRKDQILDIKANIVDGDLNITIYDNGRGIVTDKVGYINDKQNHYEMYGSNGLENVQKRLIMTYGIDYGITVESKINEYTKVCILIPNVEVKL